MMKTILAFGDSLTFGTDPVVQGRRHAYEDRWPTRLEAGLGGKARVIAEGLGGRTTVFDDFASPSDRNGARVLPTLLASHEPLDAVVVMLGTNDMKSHICGSAFSAARGMRRLVEIVRTFPWAAMPAPQVVLVSPPHCIETTSPALDPNFGQMIAESRQLATHYRRVAEETGCRFFDAATVSKASPADGVHLDAPNTRAIGDALAPIVKDMLGL
ncbi:SGNH/GDSL hydrolase family protein [Pelagibacterium sp. H642]|uniref:SGNH/GDSL hydrolase family protein n=1 Tax=Pelagibacterium sp. H642 TaxID=1881069 RepID=UPI0028160237|nr:SGNH/GDSL hydrolase family protein [Pelagibacterium sp. H642]WMT90488.1 SGNH/GDSL hydrolase family protein [Pelagibacterium sp. H642]